MDFMSTIKPVFACQKTAFNAGYNTILFLQEQTEKLTSGLLEKTSLPSIIVEAYETILSECKKCQGNMIKLIEDSFSKFEILLDPDDDDDESTTPVSKKSAGKKSE